MPPEEKDPKDPYREKPGGEKGPRYCYEKQIHIYLHVLEVGK
jgi:hypothetical protein